MKRIVFASALAVFMFVPALAASAVNRDRSAHRGAEWLVERQQSSGAFFSASQDADMTAATLGAVVAGGVGGEPVQRALAYIKDQGQARATRGAYTARIIAGIVAAGADPRSFGGVDYVSILSSQYNASTGAYDSNFLSNLVAANGALAAGETLPDQAVAYILSNACASGGFGSEEACPSGPDVETSAWAINVLVAAGHASEPSVSATRNYLVSVQKEDGGFASTSGGPTTSDATGFAISAIQALGERPTRAPWNQDDFDDPVEALKSLQDRSGGFRTVSSQSEPSDVSTVNAVPGMAGTSYPIPATSGEDPGSDEDPGSSGSPRSLDDEKEGIENDESAASGQGTQAAAEGQKEGPVQVRYVDGPGPDRPKTLASRDSDQSFGKPKAYVDRTGRTRLLAWAGLALSVAMVTLAIRLLRYGHV